MTTNTENRGIVRTTGGYSAPYAIRTVASREFMTKLRSRSYLIATALMLVLVVGGMIGMSLLSGIGESAKTIGVPRELSAYSEAIERTAEAAGTKVEIIDFDSVDAARAAAADADVDAAIAPSTEGGDRLRVYSKGTLDTNVASILDATLRQKATAEALRDQGVDLGAVESAAAAAGIDAERAATVSPDRDKNIFFALAGCILLFISVMTFSGYVATGVIEEKSSRVVEVILATVKPLHLLWGKILGLGLLGFLQLLLVAIAALVTGHLTGSFTLGGAASGIVAAVLVCFVVGYLFFGALYAAAGSLVSRMEDFQSVQVPLIIILMFTLYLPIFLFEEIDSTVMRVLAWIPPFSFSMLPMQIAAGNVGPLGAIVSVVVMVIGVVAVTQIAARIYRRSILHMGSALTWRRALGRGN